jgi:hypothetical protein
VFSLLASTPANAQFTQAQQYNQAATLYEGAASKYDALGCTASANYERSMARYHRCLAGQLVSGAFASCSEPAGAMPRCPRAESGSASASGQAEASPATAEVDANSPMSLQILNQYKDSIKNVPSAIAVGGVTAGLAIMDIFIAKQERDDRAQARAQEEQAEQERQQAQRQRERDALVELQQAYLKKLGDVSLQWGVLKDQPCYPWYRENCRSDGWCSEFTVEERIEQLRNGSLSDETRMRQSLLDAQSDLEKFFQARREGVCPVWQGRWENIHVGGIIRLENLPEGVQVSLDGKDVDAGELSRIPVGTHSLKFKGDGWFDGEMSVEVRLRETSTVVVRIQPSGKLVLSRVQPHSSIVVRDRRGSVVSVEDGPNQLAPGRYTVEGSLEGYDDFHQTVQLKQGEELAFAIGLKRKTAGVFVYAKADTAEVFWNDVRLGAANTDTFFVQPGRKTLRVVSPDHDPWEAQLDLQADVDTVIAPRLVPKWGHLVLRSPIDSSEGIRFKLFSAADDTVPAKTRGPRRSSDSLLVQGTFPLTLRRVAPGPLRIVVASDGYRDTTAFFVLARDQTLGLDFDLGHTRQWKKGAWRVGLGWGVGTAAFMAVVCDHFYRSNRDEASRAYASYLRATSNYDGYRQKNISATDAANGWGDRTRGFACAAVLFAAGFGLTWAF